MIVPFQHIAQIGEEFSDIILDITELGENSFRRIFVDQSFLNIWFSLKLEDKYSYHWERKNLDGTIFRHDNASHLKWKNISTYPKHFHNKSEEDVEVSFISDDYEEALRDFLSFIRNYLTIS